MADVPTRHPSRDELERWLEKVKARFRWREQVVGFGGIACYEANGRVFFVHDMETAKHDFGWEIYVPASNSNSTAETLAGAEAALGIHGHPITLKTRPSAHRDGQGRRMRPEFIYHDMHNTLHTGDGVDVHGLVKDFTGKPVKAGDVVHLTLFVEEADEEETGDES